MGEPRRVLYLDLVGGAAGDMILAALVDLGVPIDVVVAAIRAVGIADIEVKVGDASPAGLRARRVDVLVGGFLADSGSASAHGFRMMRTRRTHEPPRPHLDEPRLAPMKVGDFDRDASDRARTHPHALEEVEETSGPSAPAQNHTHELHSHEPHAHDPHAHDPHAHDPHAHDPHAHDPHAHANAHAHDPPEGHLRAPTDSSHSHRPHRVIRAMLEAAPLRDRVRALALQTFELLAIAEGTVHGVDPDEVVFHEVGSNDAIADIVGVSAAIDALDLDEIVISPIPLGRGLTIGAHGPIPLPGPATLELLRGAPVEGTALRGETITPTGAALIRALATRFGHAPAMTLEAIGIGAGHRTWPDRPNIIRALLGRTTPALALETHEELEIEASIDDMNPQHLAALKRALFTAGAVDVWSAPIAMKKDRQGILVSAIARESLKEVIATAFFTHSTTLGVRFAPISRLRAERRIEEVETPYGTVRVKIADRPAGPPLVAPEYDDCEALAEKSGVSLRAVYEAALRAAWSKSEGDS